MFDKLSYANIRWTIYQIIALHDRAAENLT